MKTLDDPILALGGGNMAYAILDGAIRSGCVRPQQVAAVDPVADRRALFPLGFAAAGEGGAWLAERVSRGGGRPLVLLAVKPQVLAEALGPLVEAFSSSGIPGCTFVSILAGSRSEAIRGLVRPIDRVVRVMPNTPAQVGRGMTAIAEDAGADAEDLARARALFAAVGEVVEIPEAMMDAFTAVAGSGPAYLFYLAEGMARAAESMGFSPEHASLIVRQTLLGSAALLAQSDEAPGALRAQVTSKGGTTEAATTVLDDREVMESIELALRAARDRGVELGRGG